MSAQNPRPEPGDTVRLTAVPPGLLEGLPLEDQNAIVAIVGKPVLLVDYDEDGRAELQFEDLFDVQSGRHSNTHTIWVTPQCIEPHRS